MSIIRELTDSQPESRPDPGVIVTTAFLIEGTIDKIVRDRYTLQNLGREDLLPWIMTLDWA